MADQENTETTPDEGATPAAEEASVEAPAAADESPVAAEEAAAAAADGTEPEVSTGEGTPAAEHGPGSPQVRLGKVVSDKADKTITVRIDIAKRHRRYRKIVRTTSTLHAHDERNDAHAGDLVRVVECRPMSRTKRWRLVEILERAK